MNSAGSALAATPSATNQRLKNWNIEVNNHIGCPAMSLIEAHENLILWKVLLPNPQIVAAQHLVWTIDKFLEAGKIINPFEYSAGLIKPDL